METAGEVRSALRTFSMDIEFATVDPDLFAILTGTAPPTFAVEVTTPIKRTFWQWLFRRPVQYSVIYIPHATIGEVNPDGV